MSDIHGTLLIGGMRLDDLSGACEQDPATGCWRGKLFVDQYQGSYLHTERLYRLELDDGRATQVVLHRISPVSGEALMRVEFESVPAAHMEVVKKKSKAALPKVRRRTPR